MTEVANIVDQLKRIHQSDAWHGPALKEVLADVTPEAAAARPIPGAHSIWEIVLHIAAWENVFRRRLEGDDVGEPEEGDFPPVAEPNQRAWAETLAKLDRVHDQLLNKVSSLSDPALQEPVAGKSYTIRFLLDGIIRHHVYHAGQIALLKKSE